MSHLIREIGFGVYVTSVLLWGNCKTFRQKNLDITCFPRYLSFTMLTINAAEHPLMNQFHKPTDEKRMVVILPPERYQDWLEAPGAKATEFLQAYPADRLVAEAVPR